MIEREPVYTNEQNHEFIESLSGMPPRLRKINAVGMNDIELAEIMSSAIDRKYILNLEPDKRAQYILKVVFDELTITGDVSTFFDDDNNLTVALREDVKHTADVDHRIKYAQSWLQWHRSSFGSVETGEKLLEDLELIKEDWAETDMFRAFKLLTDTIRFNRTDQYANAIVEANRLAIIIMAQATSGYTKTSEI